MIQRLVHRIDCGRNCGVISIVFNFNEMTVLIDLVWVACF